MQVICAPEYDPQRVPFNRRVRRKLFCAQTPTLINLFAGAQKWKTTSGQIIGVDICNKADLLSDDTFGRLVKAVVEGTVHGVTAGPPCRTTSACHFAEDGGPRPIRQRDGIQQFGCHHNSSAEAEQLATANVLRFRTFLLFALVCVCAPELGLGTSGGPVAMGTSLFFPAAVPLNLELPGNEGHDSSSKGVGGTFDQGPLTHCKRKPTALLCTSWAVYDALHEVRGPAIGKDCEQVLQGSSGYASKSWARWSPADHVPYRRDCEVCLRAAFCGPFSPGLDNGPSKKYCGFHHAFGIGARLHGRDVRDPPRQGPVA